MFAIEIRVISKTFQINTNNETFSVTGNFQESQLIKIFGSIYSGQINKIPRETSLG